jgi:hypothetical protein
MSDAKQIETTPSLCPYCGSFQIVRVALYPIETDPNSGVTIPQPQLPSGCMAPPGGDEYRCLSCRWEWPAPFLNVRVLRSLQVAGAILTVIACLETVIATMHFQLPLVALLVSLEIAAGALFAWWLATRPNSAYERLRE